MRRIQSACIRVDTYEGLSVEIVEDIHTLLQVIPRRAHYAVTVGVNRPGSGESIGGFSRQHNSWRHVLQVCPGTVAQHPG